VVPEHFSIVSFPLLMMLIILFHYCLTFVVDARLVLGKKRSNCVTLILAGSITVTGLGTTVFLSLAGTQEMMPKIITTTKGENLI